ncbi:MAG: hypothetical protein IJQ70_00500 [Synergistaceae bacterium]|nr:hypothetical protein [Synergistaceae bacterium]
MALSTSSLAKRISMRPFRNSLYITLSAQTNVSAHVMNTKVYNTVIHRCNTISVSQSDRKCIFDYPATNAAIDYGNFLDNFLGSNLHG